MLTLLLFVFLGVDSQLTANRCGYERTTLLIAPSYGDACSNITLWRNCVLTNVLNPYATLGSCRKCQWNGNTQVCYSDLSVDWCYPSCFSGGRVYSPVSSCSSLSLATCNSNYIISNNLYYLCYVFNSTCSQKSCDWTCTSPYQIATTGAGKNQYQCPDYYYDNGTVSSNFKWSGSACVVGQPCFHGCNGTNYTTSCSLYNNNAYGCVSHYVNTGPSGYQRADCQYNPTTALCTQSTEPCSLPYTKKCAGTNWGNTTCSFFHTSICNTVYVFDGVYRQCNYNYGSGECNPADPCYP